MSNSGIVNIHGREYKTVALRVAEFRATHTIEDGWCIVTDLIEVTDDHAVMRASVLKDGVVLGTGHAREVRDGKINSTSYVENCETSAIGRALASCGGIYAGQEYASANELETALALQEQAKDWARRARDAQDMGDWVELHDLHRDAELAKAGWALLGSRERAAIKNTQKIRDTYRDKLNIAAQHDDRGAIDELVGELNEAEKQCVWSALQPEAQDHIKMILKETANA